MAAGPTCCRKGQEDNARQHADGQVDAMGFRDQWSGSLARNDPFAAEQFESFNPGCICRRQDDVGCDELLNRDRYAMLVDDRQQLLKKPVEFLFVAVIDGAD